MSTKKAASLVCIALSLLACEDKPAPAPASAASAPTAAPTPSAAPPAPVASASAAPSASAPAPSSSNVVVATDPKAVTISMRDPASEPQKTVKAALGGTVTLYMPEAEGSVWSVDAPDKALGKAKEETIPGFAPKTNGHQFTWSTQSAALKSGTSHKVTLVSKKAGKPNGTFALTIDFI